MPTPVRNLEGMEFGDWTVLRRTPRPEHTVSKGAYWICRCSCGTERPVRSVALMNGNSTGCGCKRVEGASARATKHGLSTTAAYRVWIGMKTRCYRPQHSHFSAYGGRGIKVCERWLGKDGF